MRLYAVPALQPAEAVHPSVNAMEVVGDHRAPRSVKREDEDARPPD